MDSTTNVRDTRDANTKELFEKYGWMALRRCQRMLGDLQSAEDAMQEVFLKILEYHEPIDMGRAASLIRKLVTNHCVDILRNRLRRNEAVDGDLLLLEIASIDDVEERVAARSILRKLFGLHSASSKTIAVLHFFDGMTLEETAEAMNMSVSGVQKRLRALKKSLRKIINDD